MPNHEAFFLDRPGSGRRHCVLDAPPAGARVRGAIVHAHAWAEEMNKTRRMAALGARALAVQGYAVLRIDLAGCGDSSGEFDDAAWPLWIDDLCAARHALLDRHPGPVIWWGERAGALLASAAAARHDEDCSLLLWQPAISGRQVLQQFLRLKAAADLMDGGGKGIVSELRAALQRGQAVDVAGYTVPAALALPLDEATLALPPRCRKVAWFEVRAASDGAATAASDDLAPASKALLQRWAAAGADVHAQVCGGPAYWQTVETETAPALVDATVDALQRPDPQAVA